MACQAYEDGKYVGLQTGETHKVKFQEHGELMHLMRSQALHPTEKSFRPSHRAAMHGSILHDASYYSLIELKGSEKVLKTLLEACCDPQGQGPGAKRHEFFSISRFKTNVQHLRFLTGARILDTHVYKPESYPFDLIAPITIIWKPTPRDIGLDSTEPQNATTTTTPSVSQNKKRSKNKGKDKGKDANVGQTYAAPPSSPDPGARTVWIRSHPGVFDDVFSALQTSASMTLEAIKKSSTAESSSAEVEIADLRENVNVFEIMGPKANQVLKGALSPVGEDKREEFGKVSSCHIFGNGRHADGHSFGRL